MVILSVTPGGTYSTLASAVAALPATLTDAYTIEISGSWSSPDTTAVTISGITTSVTNTLTITTTGSARHQGIWDDSKYNLTIISSSAITAISEGIDDVTINGLQIKVLGSNAYSAVYGIFLVINKTRITIKNNIIAHGTSYYQYNQDSGAISGGNSNGSTTTRYIFNNVIYNWRAGAGAVTKLYGINSSCSDYGAVGAEIYNNTLYNNDIGINAKQGDISSNNTLKLKNNISVSNINNDILLTNTTTTYVDYNLVSEASVVGGSSLASKTAANQFISITAGSEDFHLKAGADAIDLGADLGSSYNTDIIGTSRPQGSAWDIGAFEYVSGGGSPTFAPHGMMMGVN